MGLVQGSGKPNTNLPKASLEKKHKLQISALRLTDLITVSNSLIFWSFTSGPQQKHALGNEKKLWLSNVRSGCLFFSEMCCHRSAGKITPQNCKRSQQFGSYRLCDGFTHFHDVMQIRSNKKTRCIQTRPQPVFKGPVTGTLGLSVA